MAQERFTDKLTTYAHAALVLAHNIALQHKQATVTPFHVLYAIAQQRGAAGAAMLTMLSLTPDILLRYTKSATAPARRAPRIAPALRAALVRAYTIAGKTGTPYVGTEHLVYAILTSQESDMRAFVSRHNIKPPTIQMHSATAPLAHLGRILGIEDGEDDATDSALEHFTHDITATPRAEPLIGRDAIIDDMIVILSRKEKRNPLLLGAPGVGKTAIVEGLAARIAAGTVPTALMDARIVTLDVADLVAGTTYRGEFEARIKDIIADIEEQPNTILFIDEIHTIVGAGNTQGTLDAANILKPALSRGTLRIIGATTPAEYKKHFRKDGALARRFQTITVPTPDRTEAIAILRGVRSHYEAHHGVTIPVAQIPLVVDLAMRYLPTRALPDSAFDILDEACANAHMTMQDDTVRARLAQHESNLRTLLRDKAAAIGAEDYDRAVALRTQEQSLRREIHTLRATMQRTRQRVRLNADMVRAACARIANIPQTMISVETVDRTRATALRAWQRTVIGQRDAAERITQTLQRAFTHLHAPDRPLGSFLFLGPSGTGKTHAATTLADVIGHGQRSLIRVDMSELADRHSSARMIGAPAGYVGYGDGGTLADRIREAPHSVVLFDEIEKAHPAVLTLLLQILDTGTLTDAAGDRADFRHAVVILTSNIGSHALESTPRSGFAHDAQHHDTVRSTLLAELRDHIAPEILNRLDDVLVFTPLDTQALTQIARVHLRALRTRMRAQKIAVRIAPRVAAAVARHAARERSAARAIRNIIRTQIETPIAQHLLSHDAPHALTIHADATDGISLSCDHCDS